MVGFPAPRGARAALLALAALALPVGGRAQEAPPGTLDFRQEFRGQPIDETVLKYDGVDARAMVTSEPDGVWVRLPGATPKPRAVGLRAAFRVTGDCEITTSYELLRADPPPAGKIGATLYVGSTPPSRTAVMLGRYVDRHGKSTYTCTRMTTNPDGERKFVHENFPATATAGKLRIVRKDDTATLQVAEGAEAEFRTLGAYHLGPAELTYVRFGVDAGGTDSPLEARFRDFAIRSPETAADVAAPPAAPPARRWPLYVLAVGGGGLLLIGGLLAWRRRGPVRPPAAKPK